MKVNIYIASSIKGLRRQDGNVGFILELEDSKDCTLTKFGTVEQVTENESYLRALKHALGRMTKKCDLSVWTDNAYMANAFEQGWLSGWIENDWKNAKGREVASRSEWEEITRLLDGVVPEFHVNEKHPFKQWLESELQRRAKKNV